MKRITAFLRLQPGKVVFLYAKNERMKKMRNENYEAWVRTYEDVYKKTLIYGEI